jgi:hypothetical protein
MTGASSRSAAASATVDFPVPGGPVINRSVGLAPIPEIMPHSFGGSSTTTEDTTTTTTDRESTTTTDDERTTTTDRETSTTTVPGGTGGTTEVHAENLVGERVDGEALGALLDACTWEMDGGHYQVLDMPYTRLDLYFSPESTDLVQATFSTT